MNASTKPAVMPNSLQSPPSDLAVGLDRVVRRFPGGRGVGPISLRLTWKGIMSLIGSNAAGKTTVLRCIAGFESVDQGDIEVAGYKLRNQQNSKATRPRDGHFDFEQILGSVVGIVFQNAEPWPHLRVIDNLMLPLVHGIRLPLPDAKARAESELERFGLADRARSMPFQLSGGVRQRVVLARLFALNPRILLLDEVTSALDPEWTDRVRQIIQEFAARGGAVISVSHRLNLVRRMSDSVVYMNDGKVIEQGSPQSVLDSPRDPRLRRFLENA